jgi:hypothetical protein
VLGLSIQQDGDQFCILWGENIQEGVAAFGDSPSAAICAFETAMNATALYAKATATKSKAILDAPSVGV